MPTILFANEFGSGLGHLNHLIVLAKRFARPHRLIFALDDTTTASPVLAQAFGENATLLQGPRWMPLTDKLAEGRASNTLADPFDLFGFGERERLGAAVDRWCEIMAHQAPDLIVCDTAPSLRLAADGRVPMVVVGSGYTVPPPGRPLPPIRPWQASVPAASRAVEASLLAAANEIRAVRNAAAVDHWADLFQGDDTFVCTLAPFDPYRVHRTRPQIWPYVLPQLRPGPPLGERDGPDIFAYLPAHHPALGTVLDLLGSLGRNPQVYVSGIDPQRLVDRCRPHVGIHTVPADFADILPRCRLLIHHGGLATAFAGLAAGVAQLALPLRLEHTITSQGVAQTGAGIVVPGRSAAGPIREAAMQLFESPTTAIAAAAAAAAMAKAARPEAMEIIVDSCRRHLNKAD